LGFIDTRISLYYFFTFLSIRGIDLKFLSFSKKYFKYCFHLRVKISIVNTIVKIKTIFNKKLKRNPIFNIIYMFV